MAKGLGIALVGLLAVAGGVAAAAFLTKKKLEKENEADYYDEWDDTEWLDDEDFDFDDADECISDTAADIADVNKQNDELIEEAAAPEESEGQL
ncbi:MAG: hypothetical protein J6A16_02915 [Oscillospiraceae bacterium]|nr:hypothetical protein [Oscillospiraceae bacterium]